MAKWKVSIKRVEYYSTSVVVEAKDHKEAVEKVQKKWDEDLELYDEVTDTFDDASTDFYICGLASENEIKDLTNIE